MARPNAANLIYKGRLLGYWQTFVTGGGSLGPAQSAQPKRRLGRPFVVLASPMGVMSCVIES